MADLGTNCPLLLGTLTYPVTRQRTVRWCEWKELKGIKCETRKAKNKMTQADIHRIIEEELKSAGVKWNKLAKSKYAEGVWFMNICSPRNLGGISQVSQEIHVKERNTTPIYNPKIWLIYLVSKAKILLDHSYHLELKNIWIKALWRRMAKENANPMKRAKTTKVEGELSRKYQL